MFYPFSLFEKTNGPFVDLWAKEIELVFNNFRNRLPDGTMTFSKESAIDNLRREIDSRDPSNIPEPAELPQVGEKLLGRLEDLSVRVIYTLDKETERKALKVADDLLGLRMYLAVAREIIGLPPVISDQFRIGEKEFELGKLMISGSLLKFNLYTRLAHYFPIVASEPEKVAVRSGWHVYKMP